MAMLPPEKHTPLLLHKKIDLLLLTNYRPIAMANTIYKLYTSTLIAFSQTMMKNTKSCILTKKDLVHKETHLKKSKWS